MEVIVGEELGGHLGDAVHRGRALDGVLRRVIARGVRAEGADGRGREHGAVLLAGHLEDVDQAVHLDVPGLERQAFGRGREQGGEVVDGVDVVFVHDVRDLLGVADVGLLGGAAFEEVARGRGSGDVAGDNPALVVDLAKLHREFGAYLAGRTDDENIFHEYC